MRREQRRSLRRRKGFRCTRWRNALLQRRLGFRQIRVFSADRQDKQAGCPSSSLNHYYA
uniref:Uncharacterized protein n=1 Tax=Physcomitrium patens TaxID=3218 RepID=A0A2K1IBF4_PHYPA|nr:hypothetical protein PHYPA_030075 [Physcomitrium patens]